MKEVCEFTATMASCHRYCSGSSKDVSGTSTSMVDLHSEPRVGISGSCLKQRFREADQLINPLSSLLPLLARVRWRWRRSLQQALLIFRINDLA